MIPLRNYKIMENVKFTALLKIIAFIFFIWIYNNYNDEDTYPKFIENVHEKDITLKINFIRLLSKEEQHMQPVYAKMNERLSDHSAYKRKKYGEETIPTYSQIKEKASNNFDSYIKDYKRRYRKKKGLSKLDCYCEKKVFDKILYLEEISHKIHNDKKRLKKLIFRKYGIGLILFSLTPLLGIIIPVVFYEMFYKQNKIPYEDITKAGETIKDSNHPYYNFKITNEISIDTYERLIHFNLFLSLTLVFIVIIVFFYIIKKAIKYYKLKDGK